MTMNVRTPPSTQYGPTGPLNQPGQSQVNAATVGALGVALESLKIALASLPSAGAQGAPMPQGPAANAQAGVSSFAPMSGVGQVAGARGASAAGGVDASLMGTPAGQAQGALGMEQQRLQAEKHNFPEKMQKGVGEFNQKRQEGNAKVQEKLTKLDGEIAAEQAKGGDGKKLKKLQEERGKVAGELKPPVDLNKVTSEIDSVMNDPNIPEKDRKGKLEDIRKKYDLPKNGGPLSMEGVTKHLSSKTKESKDRVGDMQKSHMKQLDGQIDQAKKVFGKDSPQVKGLEEQKKGVDGMYNQRKDVLGSQADSLHKAYHKPSLGERIGNFFKGVFKGIGNAIAAPFKAIGNVAKGVFNGIGKVFKGDFGGAFKSVTDGVKKGVGNVVDSAKGLTSSIGNAVSIVSPKLGEKVTNMTNGLVDGVGNLAKGALDTVTAIPQGIANGASKLIKGDIAGAFGEVGKGVGNAVTTGYKTVKDGLPLIATAAAFVPGLQPIAIPLAVASASKGMVESAQRGDAFGFVASMAGGVGGAAAGMAARSASGAAAAGGSAARAAGGSTAGAGAANAGASAARWERVARGADLVEAGASTGQGLQNGDFFGAAGSAAGGVGRWAGAGSANQAARADFASPGSTAHTNALASAQRLDNVRAGAGVVGDFSNMAQGIQEGDYFAAAGSAYKGVKGGVSAYNNATPAPQLPGVPPKPTT